MDEAAVRALPDEEILRIYQLIYGRLPDPKLTKNDTALLIVDVQNVCAHPEHGFGIREKELGLDGYLDYYWDRIANMVIPNLQRLMAAARKRGVEIIHSRVGTVTDNGRDTSLRYKAFGLEDPRDSVENQILPEVAPQGDEIVFTKYTSGVFNSTNIDRVLRNLGIRNLIITGVETNGCVESTVRSATELDYGTILVEDATASMFPQIQEHCVLSMKTKDAIIKTTDETVRLIESL